LRKREEERGERDRDSTVAKLKTNRIKFFEEME
jgi:hypothetical protein